MMKRNVGMARSARTGVMASVVAGVVAVTVAAMAVMGPVAGSAFGQAAAAPKAAAAAPKAGATATAAAWRPALVERVPADAVAVIAWGGAGVADSGYAGSRLARLIGETGLGKAMEEQFAALRAASEQAAPPAGGAGGAGARQGGGGARRNAAQAENSAGPGPFGGVPPQLLGELGMTVWSRPALAFARELSDGERVEWTLLVDGGTEAEALARNWRGLPMESRSREGTVLSTKLVVPGTKREKPKAEGESAAEETPAPARRRSGGAGGAGGGREKAPTILDDAGFAEAVERAGKARPIAFAWSRVGWIYAPWVAGTPIEARADESGLGKVEYVSWSAGFGREGAGKGEWESEVFIKVPGERAGLVAALMPERRVSPTLWQRVPADAWFAESYRLDVRRLLKGFADAYGDDGKEGGTSAQLQRGETFQTINRVELTLNRLMIKSEQHVRGMLLSMGPDFVATMVKAPNAEGGEGLVVINRLADAERFRTVSEATAQWLDRYTLDAEGGRWTFRRDQRPGLVVSVLELTPPTPPGGAPPAAAGATTGPSEGAGGATTAPSGSGSSTGRVVKRYAWGVRDGLVIFGNDVEAVVAAFRSPPAPDKSMWGPNGAGRVKEIREALGAPETAAVSVVDLSGVWPAMHARLVALATVVDLSKAVPGARFAALVPNREKTAALLTPAISASWADETGWVWRSRAPFPGAELAGPSMKLSQEIEYLHKAIAPALAKLVEETKTN